MRSTDVQAPAPVAVLAIERHFSVQEVAELWGISDESVRRMFEDQPGVLKLSIPRLVQNRKHKPHVRLSIPLSVLTRLHEQWASGFSFKVQRRGRSI